MKKTAKLISVVTLFALILSSLLITPASAAHKAEDWKVVTCVGKSEADVSGGLIEQTERNGIRLVHGGHYPEDNAGLLYNQSLNINDGIQLDVTIEETDDGSADMWYGIFLLNRPVYFNHVNKTEDDGFGIVLLARTRGLEWYQLTGSGLSPALTSPLADFPVEDFFAPETNVIFDVKVEDEELHIYVNGTAVAQNGAPYNFSKALPYLQDQCYVGFSMSETAGSRQSFVLNGLNGETAITEGAINTRVLGGEEEEPIDFANVKNFTLADFTNADYFKRITNSVDCEVEMADEGGIKVTVTGPSPRFSVPMSRSRWFDGAEFSIMKLMYKSAETVDMEFRFTTELVPSEDLCIVEYELEAAPEFTEIEIDMDDDNNGSWSGSEVRSLSIWPMAPETGEAGKVFYFKSINMYLYEYDETEPPPKTETDPVETDAPKPVDTGSKDTEPAGTEKAPANTDKPTDPGKPAGKANLTWLWIVIGVVAAAAVACVIVFVTKKKKK